MIKHIEEPERLLSFLDDKADPFACRIASLLRSYPPKYSFVDYWLISDGGTETGAVARNGMSFTLFLMDGSDSEEVSSFLKVAGAREVLCDGGCALDLPGYAMTEGRVLFRDKPIELRASHVLTSPDLRSVYSLLGLCEGEGFALPPFEDFYPDMNHRLRHKTSRLVGIDKDGELAAVVMTVAESGRSAVLGAAACAPKFRRQGLGSAAVGAITNELLSEGRRVYLHRAEHANELFYQSLGFSECGAWREYRKQQVII